MSIENCTFLSPSLKAKLQDGGFLQIDELVAFVHDVSASAPSSSSTSCRRTLGRGERGNLPPQESTSRAVLRQRVTTLSDAECGEVLQGVRQYTESLYHNAGFSAPTPFTIKTLAELRQEEAIHQHSGYPRYATTFCRAMDELLGGAGISVGCLTEVSGPPGVGKTQLLQQLAVGCVLPTELGGLDGECLYIDTEGSFVPERFHQIASAAAAKVRAIALAQKGPVATDHSTPVCSPAPSAPVAAGPQRGEKGGTGRLRSTSSKRLKGQKRRRSKSHEGMGRAGQAAEEGLPESQLLPSDDPNAASPSVGATMVSTLTDAFTADYVLSRVHYVRVADVASLMVLLYSLPAYLSGSVSDSVSSDQDICALSSSSGVANLSSTMLSRRIRMIVIDSIASPFRSLPSEEDSAVSSAAATGGSGSGAKSRSLWRRSRLLFACSQRLQAYAATYRLAIVVSNQVTSRSIHLPADTALPYSHQQQQQYSEQRVTILVPALGDSWAYGVSTRLLLSYHHYALPSGRCARRTGYTTVSKCREDVVTLYAHLGHDDGEDGDGAAAGSTTLVTRRLVESVSQHRVARLLKSPTEERGECCFAITRKGIRDVVAVQQP